MRFNQKQRQEILKAIRAEVANGGTIQKAVKKHKISYGTYRAWQKASKPELKPQSEPTGSDLANILFDLKSRLKREVIDELMEHLQKFAQ